MTAPVEIELIDLAPVVARIADMCPLFREVGRAADLATLIVAGGVRASPSAFVLLDGAVPVSTYEDSGPLVQIFELTVAVITASAIAGAKGEAALKLLEQPIAQVRGAMFGWDMSETERLWRRFHFGPEGVEDLNTANGVLLYRQNFSAQVAIQEA